MLSNNRLQYVVNSDISDNKLCYTLCVVVVRKSNSYDTFVDVCLHHNQLANEERLSTDDCIGNAVYQEELQEEVSKGIDIR